MPDVLKSAKQPCWRNWLVELGQESLAPHQVRLVKILWMKLVNQCPNCHAVVDGTAQTCRTCDAQFGSESGRRPKTGAEPSVSARSSGPLLVVGLILWVPTLLLSGFNGMGPWFSGMEIVGAMGPVLAMAIPGVVSISRGGAGASLGWAVALAPILLVVGSISSFALNRSVFGGSHQPLAEKFGPILCLSLWMVVGWLAHVAFSPRPARDR